MSIVLIVLIVLVVLLAIYAVVTYNGLVRLRNQAEEAFSDIDVQLKRRHDLIPNLVETVKGYATHERQVFENVTAARSNAVAATGPAPLSSPRTLKPDRLARSASTIRQSSRRSHRSVRFTVMPSRGASTG